ncbi:hypothetical protein C8R45DRAFT_1224652 [Mycena sanguinolenta]|nr:hypothetical protein C8R45DRAFT_1224652 [Mycena sanguinolenta]
MLEDAPRFRSDVDEKIIAFLAKKGTNWDFTDVETFADLGPKSVHLWSKDHKADGWMRRSQQIKNLHARVRRLVKLNRKEEAAAKTASGTKKKKKGPVANGKGASSSSVSLSDRGKPPTTAAQKKKTAYKQNEYDVEHDIASIASNCNISMAIVRAMVNETGSILQADAWARARTRTTIKTEEEYDDGDDDDDDDQDGSRDESEDAENEYEDEEDDEDEETNHTKGTPSSSLWPSTFGRY